MMTSTASVTSNPLVTETSALPLQSAALRCDARAGVARVVLEQRFRNDRREPMHVTYALPLPSDVAVSGFRFRVGDRTIEGTIDEKARARDRYEEALASGRTAALLEQDRSSLFTQEIGNVPPGAELVCEIVMDQKLRWLDEGSWEWRFPLAAAPRYLGAAGRVADAGKLGFGVAEQLPARASLAMRVRDDVVAGRSPESPSHPLSVVAEGTGFRVELGSGNAVALDRDVVVRWPAAEDAARATVDVAGPRAGRLVDAHALLTLVPPRKDAAGEPVPRDLTLLLDTSGSMGGAPIEQAKRVALALVDSLGARDRFEVIEFSSRPRRFHPSMLAATPDAKAAVSSWLRALEAGGGTEMREGILEALRPCGERKRDGAMAQVVLVTDGLIGFEQEIVREILGLLPCDARLHTVGVGSSVNRSLTGPAARAGRGIEVVIGLGEDPERATARLLARSVAPVVTELEASGEALLEIAPAKLPDLFAGAPVLVAARVRPQGGEIVLRGRTAGGRWEERVRVAPSREGEGSDAVVTLFGRERVEDEETRIAAGEGSERGDAAIGSLGLAYRVATRLTSWVAVDSQPSVDPRDPARRVEMPQALPFGTAVESFGLRSRTLAASTGFPAAQALGGMPPMARAMPAAPARSSTLRKEHDDEEEAERLMAPPPRAMDRAAPPPAPEPFFKRLRGALTGSTGRAQEAVVWMARVARAGNGELVLEIEVAGASLDWRVTPEVVAITSEGTLRFAVDASRTTRDGAYGDGTTVRLVLRVPADFDPSTLAQVSLGDLHVEVR